jgi:hypothetical protein
MAKLQTVPVNRPPDALGATAVTPHTARVPHPRADVGAAVPSTSLGKVALASFVGTTIEWYDFLLYGTAAALIFNQLPRFGPKGAGADS